ncbi:sodium:calcium antiporter [Streptomyces sp. NPDC001796]|uniref:sodium:calcium antiporter n=1 Tax=Streptomyces sp. NPDC001796 TaxID=3364609 RepID=UPI0036C868F2
MASILLFVAGAALLVFSAEQLIRRLVGIASGFHISLFLISVVFTGIEFDDIFLGVALNLEGLGGVALGVVIGTALSMTGVVLALAAILTPTRVTIPRDYVLILACAPLVMVVCALTAPLTALDGVALLGLFALFLAYVAVRESRDDTPVFRDAELYEAYTLARGSGDAAPVRREADACAITAERTRAGAPPGGGLLAQVRQRSGWTGLGLAVLALAGLVTGSAITGIGTKGVLQTYGLQGTVFGATIVTVVLTVEDIFLTVEPARKGAPEIGVGNVIGSVVFSVTGKLGIVLLAGSVVIDRSVLSWHLPALLVVNGLGAYVISTGRLRRRHGFALLALYVVYWVVSFTGFGMVPADTS